jgi:histidinol-phosphate aminotransferase
MMTTGQIFRPEIANLKAYESARSIGPVTSIQLDANESPYENNPFNRYPEPQPRSLGKKLAEFYEVAPDQLLMGRGIDELIDLLVRATCIPAVDAIMANTPTYGMYGVSAAIQGAKFVQIPMTLLDSQWQINFDLLEKALATNPVKIIFLCRPNNPTGDLIDLESVERLANLAASSTLLAVDEAYIEFTQAVSASTLIAKFPNLLVLRTFSKAWGLAGARFGVGLGNPKVIQTLKNMSAPYPISTPVIELISQALAEKGRRTLQLNVNQSNEGRSWLMENLWGLDSIETIFPSSANFILVKLKSGADHLCQFLRNNNITIRNQSRVKQLEHCVRISIGNAREMQALITAWKNWEATRNA